MVGTKLWFMKSISFGLKKISIYRSALMGLATIGILMCHASSYDIVLPFHLNSILAFGQIGVMMFFLLSGIGLYYSLASVKMESKDLLSWYKKKFIRLLVPYTLIYGPTLALECITNGWGIGFFFYKLSTLSFWFGDGGCWFVDVLILLYLIAPFWNQVLNKFKYPLIPTIMIFCIMAFNNNYLQELLGQGGSFFIGLWLARYVSVNKVLNITVLAGVTIVFLIIYRYTTFCHLFWIMLFPSVIVACLTLSWTKNTIIIPCLNFLGKISLESYLFNVTLIQWIDYYGLCPGSLYAYRYLFIVTLGVALSYVINIVCNRINGLILNKI